MKETTLDKDLDELYKWRSFIDQERINTSNYLDKYILSFSTGILAISISFTNNFKSSLCYIEFLAAGWISLIFTVVFTLLSIFLSEKAFRREIQITDKLIELRSKNKDESKLDTSNVWNTVVDLLTVSGIVTFVIGLGILSYFYFNNLS